MVIFTHMLALPAASRSCFGHICCHIAPSLSVLEFKWHAQVITISGLRFKVSHGVSLVPALCCAMDGQSARRGQMCKQGFSAWGGITQGIKLGACVCALISRLVLMALLDHCVALAPLFTYNDESVTLFQLLLLLCVFVRARVRARPCVRERERSAATVSEQWTTQILSPTR